MNHDHIIDYFQDLNTKLTDFPEKSFFRMDLTEIQGAFRSGINFPAMSVESPELVLAKSNPSNSVVGHEFAFTIWRKPKTGDFAGQNTDLAECERIGLKIIARMRYDARVPEHLMYNSFEASSVNAIKVGPLFTENLYGYRFTGAFSNNHPLQINPADWSDLESACP